MINLVGSVLFVSLLFGCCGVYSKTVYIQVHSYIDKPCCIEYLNDLDNLSRFGLLTALLSKYKCYISYLLKGRIFAEELVIYIIIDFINTGYLLFEEFFISLKLVNRFLIVKDIKLQY